MYIGKCRDNNNVKLIQKKNYKIKNKKKNENKIIKSKSVDINSKSKKILEIENIDPNTAKSFTYYFKNSDIYSKYYLKINQKNIIYFDCGKKYKGFNGQIIYDKKLQNFYLNRECTVSIAHDNATFAEFYAKFKDNKINNFNMELKKFQKYYIRSLFKANVATDLNTAKKAFYKEFNINIKLTKDEITKEKHLGLGTHNNLDLITLCKKLPT